MKGFVRWLGVEVSVGLSCSRGDGECDRRGFFGEYLVVRFFLFRGV